MKINRTFKKLIAVLCSLAMVVASITVNNVTAKADVAEIVVTAEIQGGTDDNRIYASWAKVEGAAVVKAFVNEAKDGMDAKAENGHVWNRDDGASKDGTLTSVDNVQTTLDGSINFKDGGTFTIVVVAYDENGEIIAQGTSNAITFEKYVNTNTVLSVKLDRYEQDGKVTVISWQKIGDAVKYEIYVGDSHTPIKTENGSSAYWTYFDSPQGEGTYICTVKAYNEAGELIETTNGTIELNYYSEAPESMPEDHDITKVDTSGWTGYVVNGKIYNDYYINTAGYSDITNWGVSKVHVSHTTVDYHGENCQLASDAGAIVNFYNNIGTMRSVWVNGVRYENGSDKFYGRGDSCEIALDLFPVGTHVVSVVGVNKTITFAIKVEAKKPELGFVNDRSTDENQGIATNGVGINYFYLAWNKDKIEDAEKITGKEVTKLELTMDGGNAYNDGGTLVKDVTDGDNYRDVVLPGGTHTYTLTAYDENGEVIVSETVTQENVLNKTQGYIVVVGNSVTPVDAGATYTFGDAVYGYYDAAAKKAYKAESEYTVNSNVEFEAINTLSVSVTRGAALKLSYGENESVGLRFVSQAGSDCDVALADQDTIKTGTLITPYGYYTENQELGIDSEYTKLNIVNSGWIDGEVGSYGAAVVKISKSNYVRDFVARAYITVVYADGTETTVYSNINADDHVRSATTIAQRILADTENYNKLSADEQSLVNTVASAK